MSYGTRDSTVVSGCTLPSARDTWLVPMRCPERGWESRDNWLAREEDATCEAVELGTVCPRRMPTAPQRWSPRRLLANMHTVRAHH
eukprot:220666-Prymnesium_polylepis.1